MSDTPQEVVSVPVSVMEVPVSLLEQLEAELLRAQKWHNGDRWRSGSSSEQMAWEAHRVGLERALSALREVVRS